MKINNHKIIRRITQIQIIQIVLTRNDCLRVTLVQIISQEGMNERLGHTSDNEECLPDAML